jgi:hypothetical protein
VTLTAFGVAQFFAMAVVSVLAATDFGSVNMLSP